MAETYYSQRSAQDPDWRERQSEARRLRERRQKERDPDGYRAVRRRADANCRNRQRAHGKTFTELAESVRCPKWMLRQILREELALGRIDYHSTSKRYSLNGGIPEDVKAALRDLELH